jgi:hypothetical protein
MPKPTPKTRAPRRSAEQIARDDLAMTEKKLDAATLRYQRLEEELDIVHGLRIELTRLRDYQAAHPLLCQPTLIEDQP